MHVAVIGLGLIGGSLLRALAARGHTVTGYDISPETRAAALKASSSAAGGADATPTGSSAADGADATPTGAVPWRIADSVPEALAGADLAVLAIPLPALPAVDLTGFPGLITDVTSVKIPVRDRLAGPRFVGGHPMAGKESSSFHTSDPHLFDGCAWVLCLEPGETDLGAWLTLARLITSLGAHVVPATAAEHDEAVARISHVPHLLAAALSGLLDGRPLAGALGAGSFRDGTRVAATRAEMIAAMCGGNAGPAHDVLGRVIAELETYRTALTAQDPIAALTPLLEHPGNLRRAWPPTALTDVTVAAEPEALLSLGRAGGWITNVGTTTADATVSEAAIPGTTIPGAAISGTAITGKRPETDRNPS